MTQQFRRWVVIHYLETFFYFFLNIQARIAQLVAYQLGTDEVSGTNPSKGENFSMNLSNWLNSNLNGAAQFHWSIEL